MSMRDYEKLKDIVIPESQEKIMDIICDAWEECRGSECVNCPDRNIICLDRASIMECTALKYSRMLVESGYVQVAQGKWKFKKDGSGTCDQCGFTQKNVWDHDNYQKYCGICGAKMDIEKCEVYND